MEELQSALGNRGLTVSNLPEKGRCIFTTEDFYPGEVIISQEPYVCVPKNSIADHKCDACFESSNLKKCSGCKIVYYCSSTCQKSEWKLHRLECEAFSKLPIEFRHQITPPIRLTIRLHCRSKLQSQKTIPTSAMDNYDLVKALVAHMSKIDDEQRWLYAQMANLVSLILQWPDINKKEVAENFSKMVFNAHTIYDSGLKHLGKGLYPVISIMNHSCLPNSILVFEGRSAVLRAVQHIPKGAEVLTSYIDLVGSTVTRQKALKEQYLFTCTCPRCIKVGQYDDIHESAFLEGYRCTHNECDGLLLCNSDDNGFICQQCGRLKSKKEIQEVESKIKSLQEKARIAAESASSYITYQEVIALYKAIETLQRQLFNPCCIYLIPTWEGIIENSMKLEDWSEALAYCRLTIAVYQRVYRNFQSFHPSLGLQYYTCGKLEGVLGEAENAVKSLTKAVDILQITYGTSTPFMKDLFSMLEEQREIEALINGTDY
ncbi:putative histone-lysine N-methyltransferase chromatin remodeling SET family [Rosa chinensis]|uniref:Putative histone-lysine N-methyltransferase chromatin remodeling SET family n=1 Tax=Rosa chinensis TaxID=74649 RepID=A0A2P6PX47_ROSCH|nr:histone-lysine N-methyltransferase ASHR1 [Rosa chinensis]PRQ26466.1 putative histone-lysine N-methyltransferase chromatin remodeling SET family [Rosa chinensis]